MIDIDSPNIGRFFPRGIDRKAFRFPGHFVTYSRIRIHNLMDRLPREMIYFEDTDSIYHHNSFYDAGY